MQCHLAYIIEGATSAALIENVAEPVCVWFAAVNTDIWDMHCTQKAAMASLEARSLTCATYLSSCRLMAELGPALEGNLGRKCAEFTSSTHNLTTMLEFIRHDLCCTGWPHEMT